MSYDDRLKDYEDVPGRIRQFFTDHPEGSLGPVDPDNFFEVREVGGKTFVVYKAVAKRTAEDQNPGYGCAWEPFPGTTPYTENSELMNAETSAWGRALVSIGYVAKKIASAEEVAARQSERNGQDGRAKTEPSAPARSDSDLESKRRALWGVAMKANDDNKAKAKDAIRNACDYVAGVTDDRKLQTEEQVDRVRAILEGAEVPERQSDLPFDTEGLPDPQTVPVGAQDDPDDIPF